MSLTLIAIGFVVVVIAMTGLRMDRSFGVEANVLNQTELYQDSAVGKQVRIESRSQ